MVKERKKGKAGKAVVFQKRVGSSVTFKAKVTRSKPPTAPNKRKSSDTGEGGGSEKAQQAEPSG